MQHTSGNSQIFASSTQPRRNTAHRGHASASSAFTGRWHRNAPDATLYALTASRTKRMPSTALNAHTPRPVGIPGPGHLPLGPRRRPALRDPEPGPGTDSGSTAPRTTSSMRSPRQPCPLGRKACEAAQGKQPGRPRKLSPRPTRHGPRRAARGPAGRAGRRGVRGIAGHLVPLPRRSCRRRIDDNQWRIRFGSCYAC